ncbi:hypothetical protein OJ997_06720 [Solirubrobacter phytolaccae]|uniref:Nitrile hydratase beta subunit domain-containing protein n=1 Tax=Solirubrobacter phytolaccae TaxID=1404360 RepID=A0A9X3N9A5_9ACTN|nr:hypothetical protein [Solirubrobacter phytolaccae]MDA0179981.1 hypothetical protein [Solirubrobacter phytolaccae]
MTQFEEPWEAEVHALATLLSDRGLLTWPDVSGRTSYLELLASIERVVVERDLASSDELSSLRTAWDRAAHRTPHGTPIELTQADFDPAAPGAAPKSPSR